MEQKYVLMKQDKHGEQRFCTPITQNHAIVVEQNYPNP